LKDGHITEDQSTQVVTFNLSHLIVELLRGKKGPREVAPSQASSAPGSQPHAYGHLDDNYRHPGRAGEEASQAEPAPPRAEGLSRGHHWPLALRGGRGQKAQARQAEARGANPGLPEHPEGPGLQGEADEGKVRDAQQELADRDEEDHGADHAAEEAGGVE
jgi:hypothetical protein